MIIRTHTATHRFLWALLVLEICILFPLTVVSPRQETVLAVSCLTLAALVALFATVLATRPPSSPPARLRWPLWSGTLLLHALALQMPPNFSDDVYRYLWEGHVVAAGLNPYRLAPNSPLLDALDHPLRALVNHPEIPSVYPPLAQWLFVLLAMLALSPLTAKICFAVCNLGIVWLLTRLLRRARRPEGLALLYAWHPLPVLESASSGHLDSAAILLVMVGIYLLPTNPRRAPEAATPPSIPPTRTPIGPANPTELPPASASYRLDDEALHQPPAASIVSRPHLMLGLSCWCLAGLLKLLPLPVLAVQGWMFWRAGQRRDMGLSVLLCLALTLLVSLPFVTPGGPGAGAGERAGERPGAVSSLEEFPQAGLKALEPAQRLPEVLPPGLATYAAHWQFNPSGFGLLHWLLEHLFRWQVADTWARPGVQVLFLSWLLWWGWQGVSPGLLCFRGFYAFFLLSPTAHPWYLLWSLALLPVFGTVPLWLDAPAGPSQERPRLSTRLARLRRAWEGVGLTLLSLTVLASYLVFGGENGWQEPAWLGALVYGPPLVGTLLTAFTPPVDNVWRTSPKG